MASSKARRKAQALEHKLRSGVAAASKDGDRRRRAAHGSTVRDELERKRRTQEWTIDDAPIASGPTREQ